MTRRALWRRFALRSLVAIAIVAVLLGALCVSAVPARASTTPGRTAWVSGYATWFRAPEGTAAAGPALRRKLGKHWRGKTVRVQYGRREVAVRLTDWCACGRRHGRPTVIDLNAADFGWLVDPRNPARGRARGVVDVVVLYP